MKITLHVSPAVAEELILTLLELLEDIDAIDFDGDDSNDPPPLRIAA